MAEVEVPFGDKPEETATLLLAAASEAGLEPYVVRTTSEATFMVPEEIAPKDADKAPAKKAAAKKTAAAKDKE